MKIAEYYNYFRDYDPAIGRYVQSDPIGLGAGVNTYSYVFSNPLLLEDPYGLDVDVCFYADAAMGAGHVGFRLPGESRSRGFYPDGGNPFDTKGNIKPDDQGERMCKTVEATPRQDDCMANCRKKRNDDPGRYKLTSRQCTGFVRECLDECGLQSGPYKGPLPRTFYKGVPGK